MNIIDKVDNHWTNNIEKELEKALVKLEPGYNDYITKLGDIYLIAIDDQKRKENVLGYYDINNNNINLVSNRMDNIDEVLFVFLHELSHHIIKCRGLFNYDYDSSIKNASYYLEELRADSISRSLLKKVIDKRLFGMPKIFDLISERIKYYAKKYKELKNSYTPSYSFGYTTSFSFNNYYNNTWVISDSNYNENNYWSYYCVGGNQIIGSYTIY